MKNSGKPATSWAGIFGLLSGALIVSLVLCEVMARTFWPNWQEFLSTRFMQATFVPGYGIVYTGRPGFDRHFAQNDGDFRVRVRINASGLRNAEPVTRAEGRIWVVGDSLSFGWGVDRDRSFTAVLAREAGQGTYNVASPGADVCGYQALVARMPARLVPRAVVVGLVMENDISNYQCPRGKGPRQKPSTQESFIDFNLSGAKIFLMKYSALYNFFAVSLKRVDMAVEILIAMGLMERPHAYRGHFDTSESTARADRTADEIAFLKSMLPAKTPFAVLIVPARFDIRDGDAAFAGLRAKVTAALAGRGIEIIDPTQGFREAGFAATHFAHDGHWSPRGHEVAGKYLAAWARRALP